MISSYASYLAYERTYETRLVSMVKSGPVQREVEYFAENIGKISTGDELVADQRLYRFAMKAFDLESQIFAKGLIKKLLKEGITEPLALANRLTDSKFKTFAKAFAFAEVGDYNVKNPDFVKLVIERYLKVNLEARAGEENVAVQLGLYFDRAAPRVTNWYSVLADKALREVALTGLGFPPEVNSMNVDRLVERMEERFDIKDLQDEEKRSKLIKRFTLMYDIRNGIGGAASDRVSLFSPLPSGSRGGGQIITMDASTLGAISRFS
ncbi:DUF1217 domain-containing protein [Hyphococcus sp.]|jgi:hypothetical protein|uniref:DUF1217 domain-containing protein n=1 Tax=Hyphococcus sp. TaxID=2038636 RepID=UPI003D152D02